MSSKPLEGPPKDLLGQPLAVGDLVVAAGTLARGRRGLSRRTVALTPTPRTVILDGECYSRWSRDVAKVSLPQELQPPSDR